nr:hypothetical protein [Tanacetum cinerariifolium]
EETKDGESFDPIAKTPENLDDEGNDDANLGLNVGSEEGHDAADDEDKLYRDVNINLEGRDFAGAVSSIPGIVQIYMDQRMNEAVKVKVQVSKILPKIEKAVNEQLEAEVLTRSSNSSKTSYAVVADLSEMELKKILIERMESNKNLYKALVEAYESDKIILDTYRDTVMLKRRCDDADKDEEPFFGSDRGSKRRRERKEPESPSAPKERVTKTTGKSTQGSKSQQKTASESTPAEEPMQTTQDLEEPTSRQADSRSSFNELMDTPVDFLAFLMNQLKVDTLTPELLAGPTYELIKGSCKSLRLIPFDHFINNDLEYLHGGASSRKYTTSVTKTKASDYRHIKWIEDLVPRIMWSQEPVSYEKHALWGISHWGRKRQQFYGFAINREFARDVYSKRRIIVVTELLIVEWYNYKHLDWISVHRDDDKLYKFKEGDFKRLCIQDIEDMLLLLVQGKLTNLMVKERFAFNVSLRMFIRSIVIQRRMKDLQLGVESYQKKLNLTKPDTYRFDLKRNEAYTAYSNPRGFNQNKDKQNRLMRIDELH